MIVWWNDQCFATGDLGVVRKGGMGRPTEMIVWWSDQYSPQVVLELYGRVLRVGLREMRRQGYGRLLRGEHEHLSEQLERWRHWGSGACLIQCNLIAISIWFWVSCFTFLSGKILGVISYDSFFSVFFLNVDLFCYYTIIKVSSMKILIIQLFFVFSEWLQKCLNLSIASWTLIKFCLHQM